MRIEKKGSIFFLLDRIQQAEDLWRQNDWF